MSFLELGVQRGANIPEHNRLRGLAVGDPHPQYSPADHAHSTGLGVLGYDSDATDQAISTSYSTLLSVSGTVGAGRLVRVSFLFLVNGDGTAGQATLFRVDRDGSSIGTAWQLNNSTTENNFVTAAGWKLDTPAAGPFTYEVLGWVNSGASTTVGTALTSYMVVEDLGAA